LNREWVVGTVETKDRILDAAERLFAEQGFDATSLRAITGEASVNVAAVNYHFGSKDALIEAVLARRLEPMNSERLRLLDECERGRDDDPPSIEEILRCFFEPALRMHSDPDSGSARFIQIFGRTFTEPGDRLRELFVSQFRVVARRFKAALGRSVPDLSKQELSWRMHFMIGAMAHTMSNAEGLRLLDEGRPSRKDVDEEVALLVRFAAAGLRAPATAGIAGRV